MDPNCTCVAATACLCLLLVLSLGGGGGGGALVLSSAAVGGSACPDRCDCQHVQHLLCANRGLRAVPAGARAAPEEVLVISLGGNFISNVSAADFTGYSNVVRLNLQFNQIQTVHPNAFDAFSRLEELYLGHNLLSTISPETLRPLKKLTILYTNHNGIERISPELFGTLNSLVKLRLDGNSLEQLQDSVFTDLTNLHYLHLEYNQLQHIHRNAFSKLAKLRFLNLAHNKQTSLRNNLKKLSKLSLSNNRISRLDGGGSEGLTSLRELLMDGNELRIEELDFSSNRISNVDALAFSQVKRLRVLKLMDNRLTSLSGDIFALNNLLYDLDLHGNNWTCDCRLEELKRWMATAHSRGKLLTVFIQCGQPATLQGKYLDYVNSSQLLSPGNWTHICEENPAARPEESRGGEVLEKEVGDRREGEGVDAARPLAPEGGERRRSGEGHENQHAAAEGGGGSGGNQSAALDHHQSTATSSSTGATRREVGEKNKKREGITGDRGGPGATDEAPPHGSSSRQKANRPRSRAGRKRTKPRHRLNAGNSRTTEPMSLYASTTSGYKRDGRHGDPQPVPITDLPAASSSSPSSWSSSSVQSGERFDLLRASQEDEPLPLISDPCVFNRHFITNVSVDQVTSSTVRVPLDHQGPPPLLPPMVLYDRFGTPDRFPRYVYATGAARSVTLRELSPDVTYMACVEGVVGGSVCQVAPRDHCAGLVTHPPEAGAEAGVAAGRNGSGGRDGGSWGLSVDLHLITVRRWWGNALLLLVFGGVWLGRRLRRRLQRRKSAVHVRHMYTSRRPFRHDMSAGGAAGCSRPPRLGPLDEGDLIEFPCDRFLDNSAARRDSDMQRFSD
ncbi:hypothetical protein CRUP_022727 [Coryphaenoides rupestris]|nr:hypothetical protein CRUP_022727 [Coryphaenoides rupestris]